MRQGCAISALIFVGVLGGVATWWRTDDIAIEGIPAIPLAVVLLAAAGTAAVARPPGRRLGYALKVALAASLLVLLGLLLVTVLFAVMCDDCIS